MRYIKADKIFDGEKFLSAPSVLVYDHQNMLRDIVPENDADANNTEYFKGILTPGFVNTHCHLELSHLRGSIPRHTGLPGFGKHVITSRGHLSAEEIINSMKTADEEMYRKGIVAVGDICNTPESIPVKSSSAIHYHSFIELIGLDPGLSETVFSNGLSVVREFQEHHLQASLSPHAPYSVSLKLMEKIARHNEENNLPFSIHNQESPEEEKFFKDGTGGFRELYGFLNIDLSFFNPTGTSSLASFAGTIPRKSPVLLIHNTFTAAVDIELVKNKNIFWCFCPSANLYIENTLPDFRLFAGLNENICLGTDSLASNTSLDLVQEAGILLKTGVFSAEQTLRAMCSNGARALGISNNFGKLTSGKNSGLNLVSIQDDHIQFHQKIL